MRSRLIIPALLSAALVAVVAVIFLNVSFLPPLASRQGETIDFSLKLLFSMAGGIFVVIAVFLVYSVLRFRRRAGDAAEGPPMQSSRWLVAAFFFIPLGLVLWSASFGTVELAQVERESSSHQEELEIGVTSAQWAWRFTYPQGFTSSELWLPVDRPVLLRITSLDVIHSFWVPEFRPKIDAVPGMETRLRITPTRLGDYRARCAELCGLGHAWMVAPVKVVTEEEFTQWLAGRQR